MIDFGHTTVTISIHGNAEPHIPAAHPHELNEFLVLHANKANRIGICEAMFEAQQIPLLQSHNGFSCELSSFQFKHSNELLPKLKPHRKHRDWKIPLN